jgi:hypothetical protein
MTIELGVLITLGGLLLTAGAAWGGARTALKELHTQFAEHTKADATHQREVLDRLIRIETKLEQR